MADSLRDFVSKNVKDNTSGKVGKGFVAFDIYNLVTAEDKLKATFDMLKNILLLKPALAAMGVSVFGGMKKLINDTAKSLGGLSDAFRKVQEAHAAAKAKMAQKFSSPFEKADIENTKRMTDAMNQLTPSVEKMSNMLYIVYGGAGAAKSKLAEFVATSTIGKAAVEGFAVVMSTIVPIISAISAVSLARWLTQLGGTFGVTMRGALGFGKALEFLSFGFISANRGARVALGGVNAFKTALRFSGVVAAAGIIIGLAGAFLRYKEAQKQARDEAKRFAEQATEGSNSIKDQISGVTTLEDKYNALSAALDGVTQAQNELNEALKEGNKYKIDAAARNLREKEGLVDRAKTTAALPGQSAARFKEEQKKAEDEQRMQLAIENAPPEKRAALIEMERKRLLELSEKGAKDIEAQSVIEASINESERMKLDFKKQQERDQRDLAAELAKADKDYTLIRILKKNIVETSQMIGQLDAGKAGAMSGSGSDSMAAEAELMRIKAARDVQAAGLRKATGDLPRLDQKSVIAKGKAISQGLETASPEQLIQMQLAAELKLEKAKKTAAESIANKERSLALGNQNANETQEEALAKIRRETELKIASLKEKGYALSVRENEIRAALLQKELELEMSRKSGARPGEVSRLKTEQALLKRSASEAAGQAVSDVVELQIEKTRTGRNAKAAQGADDFDVAKQSVDKNRGLLGDKGAAQLALIQSSRSIRLNEGLQGAALATGAARSSLARIGGGGGVESVSGKATSLAERQLAVQNKMKEYLEAIAKATNKPITIR